MNVAVKLLSCSWPEFLLIIGWPSHRYPRNTPAKPVQAQYQPEPSSTYLFDAWLASRAIPDSPNAYMLPGTHRAVSTQNVKLALQILRECSYEFCMLLWSLHPLRISMMVLFDITRGILPAFRGYSQALLIDEIQRLLVSQEYTWTRFSYLIAAELSRMAFENFLDHLATANENTVHTSVRFLMEYRQMQQRVRMDLPTLANPAIRDLFQESDLFVRSFSSVSGFGILSPWDAMRILTSFSELASHALILYTLAITATQKWLVLLSVCAALFPLVLPWLGQTRGYYDDSYNPRHMRLVETQDRMRFLAQSDVHRPEVLLFGLGPWILQSWAKAKAKLVSLETSTPSESGNFTALLSYLNITGLVIAIQNIPFALALQNSASLGTFTLYRSSVHNLLYTARRIYNTFHMAYQSIFLLGAFWAAMEVKPRMEPTEGNIRCYIPSRRGMKIELRDVSYRYPGCREPALRNINLTIEAGETIAIVGFNGSGKSTLANIILRILDFDHGELLINSHDIRTYNPAEYHEHVSAVFQGFSRFQASLKENIGVGYVPEINRHSSIEHAARLADASHIIDALPNGLRTTLESTQEARSCGQILSGRSECHRHGLSGGEWQRIAISRAFMRAHRPEVELLVFDEPTSSLDAHAQSHVFDTVEKMSRSPSGGRSKTVIFITHRLSVARRADKVAMMENGSIIEFGTHQELLNAKGPYASLYRASV
ncbi:P-loop containing nucleoside triphosphate hydrolase protein [Panus rudis PR-1116 ss-1]|nr:P-loop containing nucleoside triphosphate hydrolase protein [Panus rudis PR-1116 ss-1]